MVLSELSGLPEEIQRARGFTKVNLLFQCLENVSVNSERIGKTDLDSQDEAESQINNPNKIDKTLYASNNSSSSPMQQI